MRSESTVKPPINGYEIEDIGGGLCNILLYDNVTEATKVTEESNEETTIYEYDFYMLTNRTNYDNLANNLVNNLSTWIAMAKAAENAAPQYTEVQQMQQDMTDLMLENIEQGQQITDLELMILGGEK